MWKRSAPCTGRRGTTCSPIRCVPPPTPVFQTTASLEVIRKTGLENCCVAVTRYFGGILLGTGGLARAYSHAAKLAVEAAVPVLMKRCRVLRVETDYSFYSALLSLVPACSGVIEDAVFADKVALTLRLPEENAPAFDKALTELSMGKLAAQAVGEKFDRFPF